MKPGEWFEFLERLYEETNKEPEVVKTCGLVTDLQTQYEFRADEAYNYWQEYSGDTGIIVHPGKAPNANFRISIPDVHMFQDVLSGKIPGEAVAAYGILTYGPLTAVARLLPVNEYINRAYNKLKGQ